jgi:diguanylate cyclase (GGDEF)-like protein/PAS domain S-box-containing protein
MSGSRAGIGFAAAAMLAALPHLVFAGDAPLRVGVYHNPPKIQLAEGEPPTGFWPELTRVIAAAEGRSVEWVSGDWNTLLSELASSDIDVLVDVAVTEQRRERIVFGEETVHVSWSRVYAAPGVDIEVIPDLRGRRVGVLEGSVNVDGAEGIRTLLDRFDIPADFVAVPSYEAVFAALARGDVDAGVVNRDFGNHMRAQFDVVATPILLQPAELRYAFSPQAARSAEPSAGFDRRLAALKADPDSEYHALLQRWLGMDARDAERPLPDWARWALLGLLLTALLLAAGLWLVELRVGARTRKLAKQEHALRRHDQMLATSQRLAHIGSWEVDPATLRMIWTEETFRITGLAPEDGAPDVERFFEMVEPDDLPMMREALDSLLAGGPSRDFVFRLRRPDGTLRYVQERAESEQDHHGHVRLLYGAVQDITEWRQLDEHVSAFQELLEGSEDLCGVCDNEFRCIWVNTAYCHWVGRKREDIQGRLLAEIIGAEDFEQRIRPALERCLNGRSQRLETLRRDSEGHYRPILARYYPILDAEGKVTRIGAVITDISELREAESTAQSQAQLINMAGRIARLGAWSVELDPPNIRPLWSDVMAEIHGMPPGYSPTRKEAEGFFAPEYRRRILALYAACIRRGTAFDEEFQILTAEGERVWVRAVGEPVRDDGGSIVRLQGALQDISARKQAEDEAAQLEKNLRQTIASITDAFFTLDRDWRFIFANPAAEKISGRRSEDVIGQTLWDTFPEVIGTVWETAYRRAMDERVTVQIEDYYEPFGKWLSFRAYPTHEGLAVYLLDVTERNELIQKLRNREAELSSSRDHLSALLDSRRALINSLPAHIALIDHEGVIVDVNEQWRRFAQDNAFQGEDLGVGANYLRICETSEGDCADEADAVAKGLREVLSGARASFAMEYPCHSPEQFRWFRVTMNRLVPGEPGSIEHGAVVMHIDITERKLAERKLERMAFEDSLTGLPTRNGFVRALEARISDAGWPAEALLVAVNIRGMRDINDALGFEAGDRVLASLGERLQGQPPSDHIAGRTGGDEFVLFLQPAAGDDLEALLERLADSLSRPLPLDEMDIDVGTRLGYTELGTEPRPVASLLREAELALAQHRDAAEMRWIAYSHALDTADTQRIDLTRELRIALKEAQFELHFQPKVMLDSGRIHSCEALLRWNHPRHGMILPGRFIGIAEKSQLIGPIGDWILRESCRQLRQWLDAGVEPVRVAVNVSLVQFMTADLPEKIRALLKEFALPGKLLALEITESVFARESDNLKTQIKALHDIGVRLSLDDFGTGYSSLLYLQKYPFDEIKIDRDFVMKLLDDSYSHDIVRTVLELARAFGADVVAEGIESIEISDVLQELDCHIGQGRYFSYPLPGDELQPLLAERPTFPLPAERTRITM